jgi:hypothetical protein
MEVHIFSPKLRPILIINVYITFRDFSFVAVVLIHHQVIAKTIGLSRSLILN